MIAAQADTILSDIGRIAAESQVAEAQSNAAVDLSEIAAAVTARLDRAAAENLLNRLGNGSVTLDTGETLQLVQRDDGQWLVGSRGGDGLMTMMVANQDSLRLGLGQQIAAAWYDAEALRNLVLLFGAAGTAALAPDVVNAINNRIAQINVVGQDNILKVQQGARRTSTPSIRRWTRRQRSCERNSTSSPRKRTLVALRRHGRRRSSTSWNSSARRSKR